MKKLILIIALLTSVSGFSQIRYYEIGGGDIKKKKKAWFKGREDKKESHKEFFTSLYHGVQGIDFIIGPNIYNQNADSNIAFIEFIQDTVHFHKDYYFMQPIATRFDKNYSIGLVMDFMIDERHVGLFIKTNYKDGRTKMVYIKMHLDYVILNNSPDFEHIAASEPIYIEDYYDFD